MIYSKHNEIIRDESISITERLSKFKKETGRTLDHYDIMTIGVNHLFFETDALYHYRSDLPKFNQFYKDLKDQYGDDVYFNTFNDKIACIYCSDETILVAIKLAFSDKIKFVDGFK